MERVLNIASYICQRYFAEYGKRIDEMKLHKLLYFTQRECIIQLGEPMFEETFKAWRYGPVMLQIRQHYKDDDLNRTLSPEARDKYRKVFDRVFSQYASKKSWSLSTLSHGEYSWKQARVGCALYDPCDADMKTSDIQKDAERIRTRRFVLDYMKKTGRINI